MTTVPGQYVKFSCLVQGNLCSLDHSLTHYWKVEFPSSQNRKSLNIHDNSTDSYRIAIYSNGKNDCNYTSRLIIPSIPPEMSGAIKLTCVEYLDAINPVTQQCTSTLSK